MTAGREYGVFSVVENQLRNHNPHQYRPLLNIIEKTVIPVVTATQWSSALTYDLAA